MKKALWFAAYVFGGLVTGFFSMYGMLWMGPDIFHEGTPYLLALVGGMVGLALYLYRGHSSAIYAALGMVGAVFVPFFAFALFRADVTHRYISFFLTTLGLLLGLGTARAWRLRTR